MDTILQALGNTPGIEASLVVSRDGLVIEQSGRLDGVDADTLAVSASEILSAAESAAERSEKGAVDSVLVEIGSANVMLSPVNGEVFLMVLARKKANLGLMRLESLASAEKLKSEL